MIRVSCGSVANEANILESVHKRNRTTAALSGVVQKMSSKKDGLNRRAVSRIQSTENSGWFLWELLGMSFGCFLAIIQHMVNVAFNNVA